MDSGWEEKIMKKQQFKAIGHDLYFRFDCSCQHKDDSLAKLGMKHQITLTGYADDYFFDVVNKEPRIIKCDKCGKEFEYQWFRDGIICEKLKVQNAWNITIIFPKSIDANGKNGR